MSDQTILLVEDDPGIRLLTARALVENGFAVRQAANADEMWAAIEAGPVDLIVLDIMLPGPSGFELCQAIRQSRSVPIIFASARADEADRVVGLEMGADDYIPKPYGAKEVVARVRAVLRRGGMADNGPRPAGIARFDGWRLDFRMRTLTAPDGDGVTLTSAEFDLLVTLVEHAQRVIGRERLIELSRMRIGEASDRSVDVLVSRLRRKLTLGPDRPAPIITVRGVGYMFQSAVERED